MSKVSGQAGRRGQAGQAGRRGQAGQAGRRGQAGQAGRRGWRGQAGQRGRRGAWRLLREARPVWVRLGGATAAGALSAACGVALLATAAWLISRASQHPPVLELGVAVVAVRALGISRGFARYAERLAGHDAALRVLEVLRVRSYERLVSQVPGTSLSRGEALQGFATDVDAGQELLARVLLPYGSALLAGAGAVILMSILLPPVSVLLAGMLVAVCFGVPATQQWLAGRARGRTAPLRAELTSSTVELFDGLPDLAAFGRTGEWLGRIRRLDQRLLATTARTSLGVGVGNSLVVFLGGACVVGALAVGTVAVRHAQLSGVALAVVVLTPMAMLDVISALPEAAGRFSDARSALARVYTVMDRPDPTPDPIHPRALPTGPVDLRLDRVSAGWGGPLVVDGFSLDLPAGRRVALVGPSGSGKTTLACLLVRFLDPLRGAVTLNGVDLREFAGDEVRRVVGLMDENVHLFDTTIEGNLRVARPAATPVELAGALARARLLDWVDTLPLGLATPVGEHGARLSGGQRRRLALARLLLADPPVLVLDEPTEHLDDRTAAILTADLLDATRGRTVLLVTHRPFGLTDVDEIIRLDSRSGSVPAPLGAAE